MLLRRTGFFVIFLIGLPLYCYWSALSGPFLFDDFANLKALSLLDRDLSVESIKSFLYADSAGPTGRPIALLSLLLNDYGWPSEPYSFKYTNLMIHIINGLLLLIITFKLVIKSQETKFSFLIAVIISALWVLNPYNISSVMYVIQRMALLSTSFVLMGLILYYYGRTAIEQDKRKKGLALLFCGYVVGAGLGVLAKENAALYVWLVLPLEYFFFDSTKRTKIISSVIWIPAIILAAAFVYKMPDFLYQYRWVRDFSLLERLLTESRALFYYMWRYTIPGVSYMGIYADGFQKSTDLITPISTAVTLLFHSMVVLVSISLRKSKPLFSFGIAFFYVAHFMESSVVPIELMFEHRNYLPSIFLFLGLAHLVIKREKMLVALLSFVVLIYAGFLKLQSQYWSEPLLLKKIFFIENESSERSAVDYAQLLEDIGQANQALAVLRDYTSREPAGVHIALNQAAIACSVGSDTKEDRRVLIESPYKYRGKGNAVTTKIKRLSVLVAQKKCATLNFNDLNEMLDNFNSAYERDLDAKQASHIARAYVDFYSGSYDGFKNNIFDAITIVENPELATSACAQIYELGRYADACQCLKIGSRINNSLQANILGGEEWVRVCNNL